MEWDPSYPNAIVHFDGDSFFASVEQALDWRLRGKPVATGSERGIATALSIEAKRLGLARGVAMREIRQRFPEVIIVPSNYTAYSIYARRMYAIARRFTPRVEEYSIDECFADITDVREVLHASYEEIDMMIKRELEERLGITFGVGLAPSKVLAKVASKHRKPAGFTSIPLGEAKAFLAEVPIGKVWGIGSSMSVQLGRHGIRTALDFVSKDRAWLDSSGLAKPYRQMWYELQGHCIHQVGESEDDDIGSIIKSRTFTPPSKSRSFILSQLSKNTERACAVARRKGVRARAITFYLKTQEFTYHNVELELPSASANSIDILTLVEKNFDRVYVKNILYRATGITLRRIVKISHAMPDLFGHSVRAEEGARVFGSVDRLNARYGNSVVFLGTSMQALSYRSGEGTRRRKKEDIRFSIEQSKKTIDLPFLGAVQ